MEHETGAYKLEEFETYDVVKAHGVMLRYLHEDALQRSFKA